MAMNKYSVPDITMFFCPSPDRTRSEEQKRNRETTEGDGGWSCGGVLLGW